MFINSYILSSILTGKMKFSMASCFIIILESLRKLCIISFDFDGYAIYLQARRLPKGDACSAAKALMETQGLPRREWQLGKAKIFLRACVHEPLEDQRAHTLNTKATLIQVRLKQGQSIGYGCIIFCWGGGHDFHRVIN